MTICKIWVIKSSFLWIRFGHFQLKLLLFFLRFMCNPKSVFHIQLQIIQLKSIPTYMSKLNLKVWPTWHTDASESTSFINTSPFILARTGLAFVDVDFTSSAFESWLTITLVGSSSVDADTVVFAGRTLKIKKFY